MRRAPVFVGLAMLLVAPGACAAQDSVATSADSNVVRDSAAAGRAAGAAAARHHQVNGYFTAGLFSGFAIGAGAPTLGEPEPDTPPLIIMSAGITGLAGTSLHAARAGVTLPPAEEAQLQHHGAQYQRAFRDAYAAQLRSRRKRAALLGGAAGAVIALGALMFLLSHIGT